MLEVKAKADLKGIEKLTRKYPGVSRKARVAKLTEAVNLLEREVKRHTPYGAGPIHLRDTIFGTVKVSGAKATGIVGTPLEHGEPLEMGTKPHFPPTGPIQFWVERKLGLSGQDAAATAFLIARAISVRGTKGKKMFATGFEESEGRLMRILSEIPAEIVRQIS